MEKKGSLQSEHKLYLWAWIKKKRQEGRKQLWYQYVTTSTSQITFYIWKRNRQKVLFKISYAIIKITLIRTEEATVQVMWTVCENDEKFTKEFFVICSTSISFLQYNYQMHSKHTVQGKWLILHSQRICLQFTEDDKKVDYDLNKCHSQQTPYLFRISLYKINT